MHTFSRVLLCIIIALYSFHPIGAGEQENNKTTGDESSFNEALRESDPISPGTLIAPDKNSPLLIQASTVSGLEGAVINIVTDSSEWGSYRSGTPVTFTPDDLDGPANGQDLQIVGGYIQDTPDDCVLELEILKNFMASQAGKDLGWSARIKTSDAEDLATIQNRIKELETMCPQKSDGVPQEVKNWMVPPSGNSISIHPRDTNSVNKPGDPGRDDVILYIQAKSSARLKENQTVAGQQVKLLTITTTAMPLPGEEKGRPQTDYDQEPIQGMTDNNGDITLPIPGTAIGFQQNPVTTETSSIKIRMDTTARESINAELGNDNAPTIVNALPEELRSWLTDINRIQEKYFLTFTFPPSMRTSISIVLSRMTGVTQIEPNYCRTKQEVTNDPLYEGNKTWKQRYDNQWAIKRIGLHNDETSAWTLLPDNPDPVTIAVIDTGLDWNHLDIDWKNIWHNPGETPDNNIDDDSNGYVDDMIGWDFIGNNNKPWDDDGHGTLVTGIIAATGNNNLGITGINPHAHIMVLKALNSFGHTRASFLAKAVVYAVDNGARIINLGVGGPNMTTIEEEAIQYAVEKDVLIVVAAGNEGSDAGAYGIAGSNGVLTVASTGRRNEWQGFSNWGPQIDIAAPGVDVLSLRARRTDTMRDIPGIEYVNGANYVGEDKRYYRADGTSLSASIVSGTASLLMSKNPHLTAEQVKNILKKTAKDMELTGFDLYTGHGLVDAVAAMGKDSDVFLKARISGTVTVQTDKGVGVRVEGTAMADELSGYEIELGAGEEPEIWKTVYKGTKLIEQGVLSTIDAIHFKGARVWILRLRVMHRNGGTQTVQTRIKMGTQ